MLSELINLLPQFDVISFDVFDTLLLRPYLKPTDLFRKVAGETFREERIAVERAARDEARAAGREEVTYDEIYAKLPRWCDVKQRELDEERRCLTANPEIVEVYNAAKQAGKKVVIASDMYLPRAFLEEVLRGQGIDGWDAFYLSSDCGVQKATGKMFAKIAADMGVKPQRILHIGDNESVDVMRANENGLVAFCYPTVRERFIEENPFVGKFLETDASFESQLFVGALAMGWHLFKLATPQWDYWHRLGYLFGGTMGYGYVKWLCEHARAQGIKRLLMVARDGYVWQKIAKIIAPDLRTDYVYFSRKSTLFVTDYFGSTEYVQKKRRRYCIELVSELMHKDFEQRELDQFVEAGVMTKDIEGAFEQIARPIKEEVTRYFKSLNVNEKETALVDGCSMHFTIQHFLHDAFRCDLKTFYFQSDTHAPHGKTFWFSDWGRARFLFLAEFVFCAPTTSVSGIKDCQPVWQDARTQHFFEKFKISVSERMTDAAVGCASILHRFGVPVSTAMLSKWVDAFFDNMSSTDRAYLSLARDSIDTANEGCGFPIVRDCGYDRSVKRICVFGHTFLSVRWRRQKQGDGLLREVSLFGRIPIFSVRRWWWA